MYAASDKDHTLNKDHKGQQLFAKNLLLVTGNYHHHHLLKAKLVQTNNILLEDQRHQLVPQNYLSIFLV